MAARIVMIECSGATYSARCTVCTWYRGSPHAYKADANRDADNHRRREHPEQLAGTIRQRRARGRR